MLTKEKALQFFTYRPPDENTGPIYAQVGEAFLTLVENIYDLIPPGPGKTLALRKLADARTAVNSAIAHNGE